MQRVFKITVNGTDYDVAVEELSSGAGQLMPSYSASAPVSTVGSVAQAAPVAAASAASAPAGAGDQLAQMGGVVASIAVKEGQSVAEGDRVMELEAMKMKVPVTAARSGKVTRIKVAVGEAVQSGQPLLTIA